MEESDLPGQLLELMFSRSALKMKPNADIDHIITHAFCLYSFVLFLMTILLLFSLGIIIDIMASVESKHTTASKGQ